MFIMVIKELSCSRGYIEDVIRQKLEIIHLPPVILCYGNSPTLEEISATRTQE